MNHPALSERCSELIGRSQLANLLAERSFRPAEPVPYAGGCAVACELSRQAIYWALLAHRELSTEGAADTAASDSERIDAFAALWASADRQLLDRSAEGKPLERVSADLLGKSFVDFAELSVERQAEVAARLHAFATRLLEPLVAPQRELERVWIRRVLRLAAAVIVLIGCAFAVNALKERHDLESDLAPFASWKASSQYGGECSCKSPQQVCEACPNFFFHTVNENQPSVVFDLGRVQQVSTIFVENRRDCCNDRALPLVVQVSVDKQHWKTVATRAAAFTTWRQRFPSEQARWVKLYVARRDFLHLARVRLLP